jgi:hypothetical protein
LIGLHLLKEYSAKSAATRQRVRLNRLLVAFI